MQTMKVPFIWRPGETWRSPLLEAALKRFKEDALRRQNEPPTTPFVQEAPGPRRIQLLEEALGRFGWNVEVDARLQDGYLVHVRHDRVFTLQEQGWTACSISETYAGVRPLDGMTFLAAIEAGGFLPLSSSQEPPA